VFKGVHDSGVVAYSVDSRTKELVLTLEPAKGTAQKGFAILFSGVAAHQFEYPLIPSIVLDLIEIETSDLLAREWPKITKGCHQCGWPGAWATSLEAAVNFCNSQMLKGYQLEQSYGMSGWVLAKAVRCVGNP
jgi:hypothetical protein